MRLSFYAVKRSVKYKTATVNAEALVKTRANNVEMRKTSMFVVEDGILWRAYSRGKVLVEVAPELTRD